jgi:hypothetical protein
VVRVLRFAPNRELPDDQKTASYLWRAPETIWLEAGWPEVTRLFTPRRIFLLDVVLGLANVITLGRLARRPTLYVPRVD